MPDGPVIANNTPLSALWAVDRLDLLARLLIIDERRGRRFARRLGFPVIGTVGVLLLAKENGLLDSVAESIAELQAVGMHLAPDLVSKALAMAGERQP